MSEATIQIENKSKVNSEHLFDPRITNGEKEAQVIWTTETIALAKNGLAQGFQLKSNPFNRNVKDALLRKANIPFKMDEDEEYLFEQAMFDKNFFGNNFISLKDGALGWQRIKLRNYQEELINNYTQHRWNIVLFPRQSGKTTTTVIDIVHFLTFNIEKDCVVIAQSERVVMEILAKVKEAFASLPFFMQAGVLKWTKSGCTLDNGCRLFVGVASESVVQGFSLDYVFIDEFAYIPNSRVQKFWNNIYPTLANNPESKCIIASTPNGRNLFWQLWTGAVSKKNKFKTNRVYWYDVPGRDEAFKEDTISNVGLEGWLMGFECSFDTQLSSIFHTRIQRLLRELQKNAEPTDQKDEESGHWSIHNNWLGEEYDISFIKQEVLPYDLYNDYFLLGIDLGEGLGQDSTTLKIKKLFWNTNLKRIDFKTVGVYEDNQIAVEEFAEMTAKLFKFFNSDKIRVTVDLTNYGNEYFAHINKLRLYDKKYFDLDTVIFSKFESNTKKDYEMGIRWNQQNKKLAVRSFTGLVNKQQFEETHSASIEEYLNFGKNSNGSYNAQYGHDDLIMSDISIAAFVKSNNLYANEFLRNAEFDFRRIHNDLSQEQVDEQEKLRKLQQSKVEINGMILRNHNIGLIQNLASVKNKRINMLGSLSIEKNNPTVIKNNGLLDQTKYNSNGTKRRSKYKEDSDYFN